MSANGNLIVVAGAGTGKTYRLVQTCVERVRAGARIDEMLIVTFTKAAAAELRARIGAALREAEAKEPQSPHLALQIALLDRAQISTLHSFCLELVSRHFSELGLSPRLATLEEAQAAALESQTLDELFETYYEAKTNDAAAAKELILGWFRGDSAEVRRIVREIHAFTQARPDAKNWFAEQRGIFSARPPAYLRELHETAVREWVERTRPVIEAQPEAGNPARAVLLALLDKFNVADFARAGEEKALWPRVIGKFHKPLEKIFAEASMLRDWMPGPNGDPLAEDWELTRATTLGLLRIAEDFGEAFAKVKRERGLVDFADLEQFSLQLLWEDGKPSATAKYWRERLKSIFVDEYQDINPAQDRIIAALARDEEAGNRFLVGDVKQSIYGFRQADPTVFLGYDQEWGSGRGGAREDLTRNWRSHEGILDFVNGLFGSIMRRAQGGVDYDERARLQFADEPARASLALRNASEPRVEAHLFEADREQRAESGDEQDFVSELKGAEREAEMIAQLCLELAEQRRANFGDIVILMRSPASAVEAFAKVFTRRGIPFDAKRTGFFSCIEAFDLMNLLTILDNPLQDVPLLGVLRSPIGGFSFEELAEIRIGVPRGSFWLALLKAASAQNGGKAATFVKQYQAWRDLARQTSLAERLEIILEQSGYEDWAAAQDRGAQRRANVRRIVELARQFDEMRGEGLYPFLNYLQEQIDAVGDIAPPNAASQGAVRLMSVHQSKGLEFPVVIMAGLQKKFNRQDLGDLELLDETLGLCVKARPPGTRRQFETLPFWVAKQRLDKKLRDEEMRILYVALTRAKERLLLVASVDKGAREKWKNGIAPGKRAQCALDWIAPWLQANCANFLQAEQGEAAGWRWKLHSSLDFEKRAVTPDADTAFDSSSLAEVKKRLEWNYPFEGATRQEAKSSATALRRGLADEPELARPIGKRVAKSTGLKGVEAGQAAHRFLQAADLRTLGSVDSIRAELERLESDGALSEAEAESIDPRKISRFWNSDFGKQLLARPERLRRELIFTAKFTAADLRSVGAPIESGFGEDEFIVVQGAADLAAIHEREIWLVDFKTDRMPKARREEYALQVRIYLLALSRIYGRPVTWACLHFLETGETDWIRQPGYLPLM